MKKLIFIFACSPILLFAQQKNVFLNSTVNRQAELFMIDEYKLGDSSYRDVQTGFKPLIESLSIRNKYGSLDQEILMTRCDRPDGFDVLLPNTFWNKVWKKVNTESLIIVRDTTDKFHLTIDPLFNFEGGKDIADSTGEKLYKNTRGFMVRGDIGKKFSFESSFYENQATYAQYIDNYIVGTSGLFPQKPVYPYNVVPGQGRAKKFKANGYDFAMASGYVSYTPVKMVNIQVGHGKHFVGDGYRSLLLSDNSFNYPFARITTTYKNIQYTNLYTSFMNLTAGGVQTPPGVPERLFQKKIGSFQFLSANFFHRLQLGLFQGMIWEAADSSNRQHTNFHTYDPIIGVSAFAYGLHHDQNNILMGATMKLNITKTLYLYGQFMLDDITDTDDQIGNKYGYQAGFKFLDLFTIKNLHFQVEYNTVRPYAYAAKNPYQSYTHYNQALAHPLGANFYEVVGFLNYRYRGFFIELKGNYAVKGNDSLKNNFGGDIFKADNQFPITQQVANIHTTQGLRTTVVYQDVHVGYMVNPATNFNIVIGLTNRVERNEKNSSATQFVYLGFRTSLSNVYYDF